MVLNIPGLSICQGSKFPGLQRIYFFSQLCKYEDSEYMCRMKLWTVLNIPGYKAHQVSVYASITQVSECG